MSWIGLHIADDRYRVLTLLRDGGMGRIYRAYDLETQREVVLKTPLPQLLGDPHIMGRFQREIHALDQCRHPHIPRLLNRDVHDGVPFAVLPYLSGGSLGDRINQAPRQPIGDLRSWLPQIASALDFLHEGRYLHRDVRPDNILFDSAGRAFLIDFGLVKLPDEVVPLSKAEPLSNTFMFVGTIEHTAPEVLTGSQYSPAADQYSLGATVYEALTGRPPFEGKNPETIVRLMKSQPLRSLRGTRPDATPEMETALLRALAMNAGDRHATCGQMALGMQ